MERHDAGENTGVQLLIHAGKIESLPDAFGAEKKKPLTEKNRSMSARNVTLNDFLCSMKQLFHSLVY
ncbi:MAG: hypothetical protein II115_05650, partial [Prevotella sp.]|nr:hypothetical protein [Prevotella sp.]